MRPIGCGRNQGSLIINLPFDMSHTSTSHRGIQRDNLLAVRYRRKGSSKIAGLFPLAWLFGSFSRGEQTDSSDVDILFVPDHSGKPFTLFTHAGMYLDLKELLGREVDLVVDGTLRPYAAEKANQEKKLIYECHTGVWILCDCHRLSRPQRDKNETALLIQPIEIIRIFAQSLLKTASSRARSAILGCYIRKDK